MESGIFKLSYLKTEFIKKNEEANTSANNLNVYEKVLDLANKITSNNGTVEDYKTIEQIYDVIKTKELKRQEIIEAERKKKERQLAESAAKKKEEAERIEEERRKAEDIKAQEQFIREIEQRDIKRKAENCTNEK